MERLLDFSDVNEFAQPGRPAPPLQYAPPPPLLQEVSKRPADYKTQLNLLCQSRRWRYPTYSTAPLGRGWRSVCTVDTGKSVLQCTGVDMVKLSAEGYAAKQVLKAASFIDSPSESALLRARVAELEEQLAAASLQAGRRLWG
jgi:hypothetical protein